MPGMEQVLNSPLSGDEVVRIILNRIERSLRGDTRLAAYLAFPSFQFRADIAIVLTGAIVPEVAAHVTGGKGEVADDPNVPASVVTHHVEQAPMPPNEARVEADLGVPVLTRDARGREVQREVKYTREQVKRAKGQ